QRMTGLAAALRDEAIHLSLMGIAMAGGASGGGEAELDEPRRTVGRGLLQDALRELSHRHLPVAGDAGDGEVGALQRVSRLLVLLQGERGRREARDRVAALAGDPAGPGRELPEVRIAVAVRAAVELRDAQRLARPVAALAGDLPVLAAQREAGLVVVEPRTDGAGPPAGRGVALLAVGAEAPLVGVLVAIRASGVRHLLKGHRSGCVARLVAARAGDLRVLPGE